MLASRIVLTALIAALSLPALPDAGACGGEFPIDLLSRREEVMTELPEGIFFDEVKRLVPAPGPYRVVVDGAGDDAPTPPPPGPPPSAEELHLYERGAHFFRHADYLQARFAFTELLALPADQRRHRSTWAAYMLGRIDDAGSGRGWYQQVRRLADEGFHDELGLAASSLGQEARLHDDMIARVTLYAQQAALGHVDGPTSLLFVTRGVIDRGAEAELLAAPIGQQLLAAYLWCRDLELDDAQRARLWAGFARIPRPAGADYLAAAAYRAGDPDRAARLVAGARDTATARWVRAKLAVRANDRAAADVHLARAAAQLAALDRCEPFTYGCDHDPLPRVTGERLVIAVADGRYTDALQHAWDAREALDAAYLAERVLTPAELRAFLASIPDDDARSDDPDGIDGATDPAYGGSAQWGLTRQNLRNVFGRRLMRAGRYREAIPYLSRAYRTAAIAYGASMEEAARTRDPIAQARALYDASVIARRDGMEILGTEHAPDWAAFGGQHARDADPGPPLRWTGPGERLRVSRSRPAHDLRYHYRYVAYDLARAAADRLPHRSQAFAATLCEAGRYVRHTDTARLRHVYHRYLADGPAAVTMEFGVRCPDPAFDRARRFLPAPGLPRALLAAGAFLVAAAVITLVLLRRRRHRRFAARP